MGDYGDGSTGGGDRSTSLTDRSAIDATAYNIGHGGERFRVVAVIGVDRFVSEKQYARITPALERVVEIEREAGVKAFVLSETFKAMR